MFKKLLKISLKKFKRRKNSGLADKNAIKSDCAAIGNDFKKVMSNVGKRI